MKLVVAATGTSSAARPLPQAAPDPTEEGNETILCGPCSSKQGEAQASGTNIMTGTKKNMVVVSVANGVDAKEYGASSIARKCDGGFNGEGDDATCSDTSCTDSCTDDDSEATSVDVHANDEQEEENNDNDGEFEALLQQVHELISQRKDEMIDRLMIGSKIIDLNDLYIENLKQETEVLKEIKVYLEKKNDTKGKAFAGRRDLTRRKLNTRLRELKKEGKVMKGKISRQERMREEKSSEIQATSNQISDRLTLMASKSEEYISRLLERAYKSKRCAHCLNDAWKKKEGVKTTNRCSGCKAVHYCNEDCQAANWDVHQHFCQNMKERRDERIAKWYEKDRRHRDFEKKLNCGWYGEESDVVGLAGSAGPFLNELLGFGGTAVPTKDSMYGSNAEDKVGDFCCMSGCVIG